MILFELIEFVQKIDFILFGAEGQTFTLADLASEFSSRYSLRWTAQRPVDSLDFRRIDGHRQ